MLYSVEFLTKNAKDAHLLYYYCLLREAGKGKAGYFIHNFKQTHHFKYRVLPELIKRGWVSKNKVISHRAIFQSQNEHNFKMCRIEPQHLENIKKFKGFLISIAETSILNWKKRLQDGKLKGYSYRDRVYYRKQVNVESSENASKFVTKTFSDRNASYLAGYVSNSILAKVLGVSTRTISTWRKESSNSYLIKKLPVSSYKAKYGKVKAYYSKKRKCHFTVDMLTITSGEVFNNKYTKLHML